MLRNNIFGQTYDDALPCFTINGEMAFNRIDRKIYSIVSLNKLATQMGYTWKNNELSEGAVVTPIPGPIPGPITGPYHAFGVDFWVNSLDCTIGANIDDDAEADVWLTKAEACAAEVEDRVKLAVSAQLVALGCGPLPCITASGALKKAFRQEEE